MNEFVESGKAAWWVAILFIILACFFGGCVGDKYYPNTKLIVEKINREYGSKGCKYSDYHEEDWIVVDSCDKWNIGDTITITIE